MISLREYATRWYRIKYYASRRVLYCQIHLTERCQYRCSHCYFAELGNAASEFAEDDLVRALGDWSAFAKSLGMFVRVDFTGGDPFLYSSLERIFSVCRELGLVFGLKCNPDHLISIGETVLARQLQGCDSISLSLDGPPEFHNKLRHKEGAFESVLEAARVVNKLGMRLRISTTVSLQNKSMVVPILKLLQNEMINIDAYTFARYWSEENSHDVLRGNDLVDIFDLCSDFLIQYLAEPSSYASTEKRKAGIPRISFAFKEHLWFPYLANRGLLDNSFVESAIQSNNCLNCSALRPTVVVDADGSMYKCRKIPESRIAHFDECHKFDIERTAVFRSVSCLSCMFKNVCFGCPAVDGALGRTESACPLFSDHRNAVNHINP